MEKGIVLFGTGTYGQTFTQIMEVFSIPILYYADNNKEKWGMEFNGKTIISPGDLLLYSDLPIVIACSCEDEVLNQLEEMGISHRVLSIHKIKMLNQEKLYRFYHFDNKSQNTERTVIIDNFEGEWGGIEEWSHDIVLMLRKENIPAFVLESSHQTKQKEEMEQFIIRLDRMHQQWITTHLQLMEELYDKMPFVLFNNRSREVLYAAEILRCLYPGMVKIITVLHCDLPYYYAYHAKWDKFIDKYLCISSRIQQNFCELQGIKYNRTLVRTNIAPYHMVISRHYAKKEEPIRIGFACRLAKEQKRAHLLPEIIKRLEKKNLNYRLEIAGNGECTDDLKDFIKLNQLEHKVRYLGFISKEEMGTFWKRQDIYLNLSEYEGLSLAMLEAMSYGAIPVVTQVSGVDDVIENGVSGLVYGIDDLDGIADGIIYLEEHKEMLKQFGNAIKNTLAEKCDKQAYIKFFQDVLDTIWD